MKAPQSVYFVSLGCPKNLVDSQIMLGKLEKGRFEISRDPAKADVIIVNTCSFIEASKEESIDTLLDLAEQKNSGRCKVLVATGCLVQRYVDALQKELPEIDLFLGTGQYHRITEALDALERGVSEGDPMVKRTYVDQPAFIHSETDERRLTGPAYSAFLKISEGCNRRCAFCIIPKLRGNVRSRTVESLVTETRSLASQGVREVNLVGQDLTEYGMEWKYRENLATLLPQLAAVDGIEWIRLHYVYPDQFSDGLVEIVAREPKIVKYLDMPIQHTVDRVLSGMNRRLTKKKLFDLVGKLRARIPGLVFRTSIIVGFPGETEADFQEMLRDLRNLALDHLGVFRYSREEGTPAATMGEQVHAATKRRRAKELQSLLSELAAHRQEAYVGTTQVILFHGANDETELLLEGRLPTQAQEIDGKVLINDLASALLTVDPLTGESTTILKPGDLLEVEISKAIAPDFLARALRVVSPARSVADVSKPGLVIESALLENRNLG
ncbi:MAG: 30S ribosomal protein S12 methylthiotransferase RimO, partial [Bdellovibrionota bacterium]